MDSAVRRVDDSENCDPTMTAGLPNLSLIPKRRAPPRRADRLRHAMETPVVQPSVSNSTVALGEVRKIVKQPTPLGDPRAASKSSPVTKSFVAKTKQPVAAASPVSSASHAGSSSRTKSSWREEQRNQELQARMLAGLSSPQDTSQPRNKVYSSWKEERVNHDLRDGKMTRLGMRHNDYRSEPENVEVSIPKPPPVPPTAAEMEEIKVKVQQVMTSGIHVAEDVNHAARKISTAFQGSNTRHRYLLHSSARTIQTMWRGVGPRRAKEAALSRLKIENAAATKIQTMRRMVVGRQILIDFRAARLIQTAWRGYLPRILFWSYQRSTAAAIKIQSAWRSFACYCQYTFTVEDIVVVQRVARNYIARQRQMMHRSANKIQRVFRGHRGRKKHARVKHRHAMLCSAKLIQRVARGNRARAAVERLRMLICKATTIQKYWRRYKVQQGFWLCIGCVIDIQSVARAHAERKRYLSDLRCIVMSQSAVRRWIGCRRIDELRRAKQEIDSAIKIQTWRRCCVERQKLLQHKRVRAAATKIQAAWRSFVCYSDFIFTISDIVLIQGLVRSYLRRKQASTLIQTTWRAFACKVDYMKTWQDVVTIQRTIRGHFGRKRFAVRDQEREEQRALARLRNKSANQIQSAFRGYKDRTKVALIRLERRQFTAATAMQSVWRSYVAQETFIYTIGCVIQIQSVVRGFVGRLSYIDDLGSIILSQSAIRRWIATRLVSQKRLILLLTGAARYEQAIDEHAVITLQSWFRNVVRPKLHFHAAVKVQSFFRMVKAIIEREIRSEMNRRKQAARLRKEKAIKIQSCWRAVMAIDERGRRADTKMQVEAAIKIQSYFRMAHVVQNEHAKRCSNAATTIQAFFRMVRAMVDREIKEQLKRRKIRKMLKNRTKEIDDLMLEEAWVGMSTSNDSNVPFVLSLVAGGATITSAVDQDGARRWPAADVQATVLELKASTSSDSTFETVWKSMPQESKALREAWSSMSVSEESVFEAKRMAIKKVRSGQTRHSSTPISEEDIVDGQCVVTESRRRGRSKTSRRNDKLRTQERDTTDEVRQVLRSSSMARNITKTTLPVVKPRLPPSYCQEEVCTDENPPSEMVRWRRSNDDSDNASEVSALTAATSAFQLTPPRSRTNALAAYQTLRFQSTMVHERNGDTLSKIDSFTEVSVDTSVASTMRNKNSMNSHAEKGKRHFRSRSRSREPLNRCQDV